MGKSARRPVRHVPQQQRRTIAFAEVSDGHWGEGPDQRRWHITRAFTGWRLEFLDPTDETATYAGTHSTLDRAKLEAEVVTGVNRDR